ncbi:hypothetical protein [Paramagnetospirillum magneticum]|uniref:Uncharacterized protein n=1 Tax=Paramagnetospirillum magneticum (strain ATCC 700264 / AMB-1) TaxID=342108 RepID=Q2W3Q4_PARM1|nr:hypothetical protein [Paramagnetospirillum magneticum]BAE51521.1 hypothetical protein amb2717 [Paramagnetospirillum magneticum AMB-1]
MPQHIIDRWRRHALDIVNIRVPATNSQQALAWRFLRQWGV